MRHSHESGRKRNKDDVIERDKRASQLEKRYSASHMRKCTRSHEIARFSSKMGGQGRLSADRGKGMEGTILCCWWEGEFGTSLFGGSLKMTRLKLPRSLAGKVWSWASPRRGTLTAALRLLGRANVGDDLRSPVSPGPRVARGVLGAQQLSRGLERPCW